MPLLTFLPSFTYPLITGSAQILALKKSPFAGYFPVVSPGEVRVLALDFSAWLINADDLVASAISEVKAFYGDDPNAAGVAMGSPGCSGGLVVQLIGGLNNGFQADVIYDWIATATTFSGQTLIGYGRIACNGVS